MELDETLFYLIAIPIAVLALIIVFTTHIVRAAIWLLFTLIGTAFLYFLLDAAFVAASQLMIYVGGILVLLIFAIMLTNQNPLNRLPISKLDRGFSILFVLFLGLGISVALYNSPVISGNGQNKTNTDSSSKKSEDQDEKNSSLSNDQISEIGTSFFDLNSKIPSQPMPGFPEGFKVNRKLPPRTNQGYLLPFELISIHLLVILIGAAYLARAKYNKNTENVSPSDTME